MELGVCLISPVTPSFPLPPRPTGQFTDVARLTLLFHSSLTFERKSVQMYVVPLPSERCTTTISFAGRFTPLFAPAIAGSFHLVIFPKKIPASASGVKLRLPVTPGTL